MSLLSARMKIQSKIRRWSVHNMSPIISLWGFFQTLKGSSLCSQWSDLAEFDDDDDDCFKVTWQRGKGATPGRISKSSEIL